MHACAPLLSRSDTALCIVDSQEKLFPLIAQRSDIERAMRKAIKGFLALKLPIVVYEQYPKGLGRTLASLVDELPEDQEVHEKTTFSCMAEPAPILLAKSSCVLIGIETHVCVLQTARDLLNATKQVVVLADAVSARASLDHSSALLELRQMGARVSTVETVLFELLRDAKAPGFKAISELCKTGG